MNIILFYQHKVRELKEINDLSDMLAKRGHRVNIFQIDFAWTKAIVEAKAHGVDAVIMPWLYHSDNYALLTPFLKINSNLVIMNLHHEQISSPAYESIVLPQTEEAKNGCYHFSWGTYFADKLIASGVNKSLVRITGDMRLDNLVQNHSSEDIKKNMAKKFGLAVKKPWLLFAENRGWVYKINDTMIEEYVSQGVSKDAIQRNKHISLRSLELLSEQIDDLSDSFFDEFELIYRPHPGQHASGINKRVHVISERPVGDWLACVDTVIVWGSTVAYESMIAGVPAFRHEPIPNPSEFLPYGFEDIPLIKNIGDITPKLIADQKESQSKDRIYEYYYGVIDGNATSRIVDETCRCLQAGMPYKPPFVLAKSQKTLLRRKRAFELATSIFSKTGLLRRTRWPRSAFNQITDIPYEVK